MTPRRSFLGLAAGSLLGLRLSAGAVAATRDTAAVAAATAWSNWSGIERCQPRAWPMPATLDELAALVKSAPGPLRCVGAGHSFSALVPTPGTLLSIDRLQGLLAVDRAAGTATFGAGTRIAVATRLLDEAGLSLMNQPDIDMQTLAGALATATHGTGQRLGAMHKELVGLKLLTPAGELLSCSPSQRPDLFAAAQVSLGSLGVLTEVTLKVRPRHFLRRHVWLAPNEELFAQAEALAAQHLHFELYLLPFTGYGAAIAHDEVPVGKPVRPPSQDEDVLGDLKHLRDWLGRFPSLRRWVAGKAIASTKAEDAIDVSYELLSSVRPTRFNESECHVPRERGVACLREVLATLERRNDVFFPIEFRFIQGDDAWLSPFHGRDSCSIAVHALQGEAYDYLLRDVGAVFRRHGGRPHWGKLHDLSATELASRYPRWKDFLAVRAELDPRGRLLTPYMARLFGLNAPGGSA
ncbi:D-arabinono-1,4-lactone oxidase [Ideonella sp. BN130291]|uniref:D-arabinono-1,4-lactone oxidase n=1 Tax=Ideonella sp. BN130291 TaxID=3112940 RepID=UPI002E269C37|nr:D-arabinono-1,4-lactone oxidase [Ideonella sp. BN130291]